MDEFKLRSLDEFDVDFKNSLKSAGVPARRDDSLIPEFTINEVPSSASDGSQAVVSPAIDTPLYTPDKMSDGEVEPLVIKYDSEAAEEKEPKKKKSAGALIAKIAAIAVLVFSVLTFIIGCFVSVFLDNNGSAVFGKTLNTLAADTALSSASLKAGDLIIADKGAKAEYSAGNHIAVPTAKTTSSGETKKGCDIMVITQVVKQGTEEQIMARVPGDSFGVTTTYEKDACYGTVSRYVPAVGGIVGFAMDNAILVCALFVLIAALMILILVLVEKSESKKKNPED